jgi:hydrogenase maturation factor HypF (carbamoyltransferase family)
MVANRCACLKQAGLLPAISRAEDRAVSTLGDLATKPAHDAFIPSAADLPRLYEAEREVIAHDLHPEYLSRKFALQQPGRKVAIQHQWAHIVACMAENEIAPPALGGFVGEQAVKQPPLRARLAA